MKRRYIALTVILAMVGMASVLFMSLAVANQPKPEKPGGKRVFLILINEITVTDLLNPKLKNISELLNKKSAVALMSTRTAYPTSTSYRTYTTLGSGNRATASGHSVNAVNVFEKAMDHEGSVSDIYYRRTGQKVSKSTELLHLGISTTKKENLAVPYNVKVGLLGDNLRQMGVSTAVFGNADKGIDVSLRRRESVMTTVDSNGKVDFGNISGRINKRDHKRPFGIRTDYDKIAEGIGRLPRNKDLFIAVDTGDTSRAAAYSDNASDEMNKRYRHLALQEADDFLGKLFSAYGSQNAAYIIATVTPAPESRPKEELTPVIMSGRGFDKGLLKTAITRRDGIITLTDLAPTIIGLFDPEKELPNEMSGRPVTVVPSNQGFADINKVNRIAIMVDKLRPVLVFVFIIVQVAAFLTAGLVLWLGSYNGRLIKAARIFLVSALVMPVSFFLIGLLPLSNIFVYSVVFLATVIFLMLVFSFNYKNILYPIAFISALTFLTISLDAVFGANLNMNTALGYSPIIAGRFYGIGNQAMSVLLASSLILTTTLKDIKRGSVTVDILQITIFSAALIIVGLPNLGSNTGGTVTLLAAYWAAYMYQKNKRLRLSDTFKVVGILGVFFTVAVTADIFLNTGAQSHLTRLITNVQNGGLNDLYLTVQRKLMTNWRIFRYSSWSYLLVIIIALFAMLRLKPSGGLDDLFKKYPGLLAAATGCLAGSAVGFVFNDSGISIPALILSYFLPIVLYLMLYDEQRKEFEKDA